MSDREKYGGDNWQGLYALGPKGPICVLAFLIYYTHCAVSAATPEGERTRKVRYTGARMKELRDGGLLDEAPTPKLAWNGGRYLLPTRPATSGRKRKAA